MKLNWEIIKSFAGYDDFFVTGTVRSDMVKRTTIVEPRVASWLWIEYNPSKRPSVQSCLFLPSGSRIEQLYNLYHPQKNW